MPLRFTILTLFPEMFPGTLEHSLSGKALERGDWSYNTINIRDHADGVHKSVDDTPFGGGAGMVMRADVIEKALLSVDSERMTVNGEKTAVSAFTVTLGRATSMKTPPGYTPILL